MFLLSTFLVACVADPFVHPPRDYSGGRRPVPTTRTEAFFQAGNTEVDLLLLFDNTGADALPVDVEALSENLPFFLGYLLDSGIDYRVALTDPVTDPACEGADPLAVAGGFGYIDRDDPNPGSILAGMMLELQPCDPELTPPDGFDAVFQATDPQHGFRRPGIPLHTVVFAENDEAGLLPPAEFADLYGADVLQNRHRTFSVVGPDPLDRYREAVERIGSPLQSRESPDWPVLLDEIGRLSAGLEQEFFLSGRPDPDTLQVEVAEPVAFESTFNHIPFEPPEVLYDSSRNSIRFPTFVPKGGSQILVTYQPASERP